MTDLKISITELKRGIAEFKTELIGWIVGVGVLQTVIIVWLMIGLLGKA